NADHSSSARSARCGGLDVLLLLLHACRRDRTAHGVSEGGRGSRYRSLCPRYGEQALLRLPRRLRDWLALQETCRHGARSLPALPGRIGGTTEYHSSFLRRDGAGVSLLAEKNSRRLRFA